MAFRMRGETRRQNRPGLEVLERRIVLSTFHAANVAQLQADIAAVNNTSGPNTIFVAPGVYSLTNELQIQDADNLTIQAASTKGTVNLVGSVVDRVLEIDGGHVTLSGLWISGGGAVAQGGGILARNASLTLQNTKVVGNMASQAGGGIFAEGGTLNLQDSSVTNNRTSNNSASFGGGIVAQDAAVTLSGSTVSENSVYAVDMQTLGAVNGTGGGIYTQGGTLAITSSTISGNTVSAVTTGTSAATSGAAVSTFQTAVTVASSTLQYNALSTVSYGTSSAQGGAFSTVGGSLTIADSRLSNNTPARRNAFAHSDAAVTIRNLLLDGRKLPKTYTL